MAGQRVPQRAQRSLLNDALTVESEAGTVAPAHTHSESKSTMDIVTDVSLTIDFTAKTFNLTVTKQSGVSVVTDTGGVA